MSTPPRFSRSLFVELSLDRERRCFEFGQSDDHAVTVGSSLEAHWCVDRRGVPPVAFHLERERDEIHVTPHYETELRLNSKVVKRRATLSAHAILEFHGVTLHARVSRERPRGELPIQSTRKLCRPHRLAPAPDGATVPVDVRNLHHDTEPVQYFMTEVIQVVPPRRALPKSIDTQTTSFEAVQPSRIATPPSARVDRPASDVVAEKCSAPAVPPALASRRAAWLTRLGLLTKAKPLPVLATTLGVALLIGVLAANTPPLFTATPVSAKVIDDGKAKAPARPASSPASVGSTASPAPPALVVVARVVTPTLGSAKPELFSAKINDSDLARAVAALGSGRHAEAAQAYASIAARRPDSEVYRAIARLLEKASSADCTPSRAANPSCPEVQP